MTEPPVQTRPMQVTVPVHNRLAELQRHYQAETGRRVTFSEVIERLLAAREQLAARVAEDFGAAP